MARHTQAMNEGAGAMRLSVQVAAAGTLAIVGGPLSQIVDVSINGSHTTGIYIITIQSFKGSRGIAIPMATLVAASGVVRIESATYTGDALAITVNTYAVDGTTATNKSFNLTVDAF